MQKIIYSIKGQEIDNIQIPEKLKITASTSLMHEVITGFLANQRVGCHSTKTRGEVSGGGRKPWKEKGTGNARAGSNRSPLWRKGGIIFGPKPHKYIQNISQKKRRLAINMALSDKIKNDDMIVVDNLNIESHKTKMVIDVLKCFKIQDHKVVFVLDSINTNLKIASKNIENLVVTNVQNINAYQFMWAQKVIITKEAINKIINEVNNNNERS